MRLIILAAAFAIGLAGLAPGVVARVAIAQPPAAADAKADAPPKKDKKDLPLETARTVEFTTDEASWVSLDVSPDGKTIVFDLLGDLYTLPVAGGKATRITSGMAFDSQPRFSPDGLRIVFISDRSGADNVWIAGADGSEARPLTKAKTDVFRSPEWAPDGQYVVVSRTNDPDGMQLWLYHVDGGGGVKLTGRGEEPKTLPAPVGAAFGKDARYVHFSQRTSAGSVYNQMRFRWQLAVYDRRTGEVFLQSDELGSGMRPALSPDGRWLVYATRWDARTGYRVRDLTTGDDEWLLYPVQRDDQESASTRDLMPGSSFTPDSKALVTSFDGRIWRVEVPSGQVSPIPFEAKVELGLGPLVQFQYAVDEGPVRAQQIRFPRLSPDGKRLAFTALGRVYVTDYPKGTPRRLSSTDLGEHQPTWSPDGRFIAYVTWSDQEGGHVYRAAADGSRPPEPLTRVAGFYSDPIYSPDGRRIVVVRGPRRERQEALDVFGRGGQPLEMVWLAAEGGPATRIAPFRGPGRPHFGPDPERIFAWEVRSASPAPDGSSSASGALVSFRYDGTDRRPHVKVTGWKAPFAKEAGPVAEVLVGPDGEHAIVEAQRNVYLIVLPAVGGEAPTVSVAKPDDASVPVKRLTTVGGEFLDWAEGGKAVTFALGRVLFRYDLAQARAAWKKEAEEARAKAEGTAEGEKAALQDDKKEERKKPAYEAAETEVVVEAPRPRPRGTVALRGARVITMKGMEVIEDADLVITDNRIAAVGRHGEVAIPAGARSIDVSGKTILPGLVDVHAHIWPSWKIHRTQVWEYLANLAYGVTTTRDPQTATTDVLTYRDLVETGRALGPRVFATGPGVFSADNVQSLDEARDVLKRYSRYWDTKTIKQYMAGNRQQRQWIAMAAREQGLTPTLEGGLDLKLNLTQIMDGYAGLEHTLPVTPLYRDVVRLLADSGITYTPTLLVQYGGPWAENYFFQASDIHGDPKLRRFTPHQELDRTTLRRPWFHEQEYSFPLAAKVLADVVKAGGRVGLGGHGQQQGIQCHWELWAMASGGMPTHDALRVATIVGAEAIGLGKDLGSVEQGKLADLVVLDQSPLENIRNTTALRYVVKNGEVYEADTLDQVWPEQKKLARQYWWDLEPKPRVGAPAVPTVAGSGAR